MLIGILDGEARMLYERGVRGLPCNGRPRRLTKAWCDALEREIVRRVENIGGAGQNAQVVVIACVVGGGSKRGR